jgi:hypothetical protein
MTTVVVYYYDETESVAERREKHIQSVLFSVNFSCMGSIEPRKEGTIVDS